jgi:hypothetical protein
VMQGRGMALPPQVAHAARARPPVEEFLPLPPPPFGVAPRLP